MESYVVDTDVVSDLLMGDETAIAFLEQLKAKGGNSFLVSQVTRSELLSIPGLTDFDVEEAERLLGRDLGRGRGDRGTGGQTPSDPEPR